MLSSNLHTRVCGVALRLESLGYRKPVKRLSRDMFRRISGGLAQLGEHLLCKQGVVGSIPSSSTTQTETNTKAASSEVALLLAWISRSIGCSLKIHRVESALLMETVLSETRGGPCHQRHEFLIASKRIFRLRFEIRASKRKLHAAQRVR